MDKSLAFFVKGQPKPQPRHRAIPFVKPHAKNMLARDLKPICDMGTRMVLPGRGEAKYTVHDWKDIIIAEAFAAKIGAYMRDPISGAVKLSLVFRMHRPKYMSHKKYDPGRIPHICTPDRDNLEKAVMDALTNAKLWKDDCIVFDGPIGKWYHAIGEDAGVEIRLEWEE